MKIFNQRVEKLTTDQASQLASQAKQGQCLELSFDTRQRSRFRAEMNNGEAVGVDLPRTGTIKHGDVVGNQSGDLVQIFAKPQTLTKVTAPNTFDLMRGAYHLGNRHVPLMLTESALYFEPDHVLESMLIGLGLACEQTSHYFEPEIGAYSSVHSHSHSHDHSHSHSHSHDHPHSHGHGQFVFKAH